MRLFHSMYQMFTFTMLLVLTTKQPGHHVGAMEAATLTTVLLVALYRTHASLEAAWKYFILCGVGIAQALARHHPGVFRGREKSSARAPAPCCGRSSTP